MPSCEPQIFSSLSFFLANACCLMVDVFLQRLRSIVRDPCTSAFSSSVLRACAMRRFLRLGATVDRRCATLEYLRTIYVLMQFSVDQENLT